MNRLLGWLAASGAFLALIWQNGRSQMDRGKHIEKSNQLADALENLEEAKRINDQIDKDIASLPAHEREQWLRDKYTRH